MPFFVAISWLIIFLKSPSKQAKWIGSNWHSSFVILYQDSTLIWYASPTVARPEGSLMLKHSPELIQVGQFALRMFKVPDIPNGCIRISKTS